MFNSIMLSFLKRPNPSDRFSVPMDWAFCLLKSAVGRKYGCVRRNRAELCMWNLQFYSVEQTQRDATFFHKQFKVQYPPYLKSNEAVSEIRDSLFFMRVPEGELKLFTPLSQLLFYIERRHPLCGNYFSKSPITDL